MTFLEEFEQKNITMSLCYYGPNDFATSWDIKAIIDHPEVFDDFFNRYILQSINSTDDFLLYLFAVKLAHMKEMAPYMKMETDMAKITVLAESAEKVVASIHTGNLVRFLNSHLPELFSEAYISLQIRTIVLDYVEKYQSGIDYDSMSWLCTNYGYLLLDHFNDFEKMFEKYPELLSNMFPNGTYEEIDSYRFSTVLNIFVYIENRKESNLKTITARIIPILYDDMKRIAESMTTENVMRQEHKIREFDDFLKKIKSPLANTFAPIAHKIDALLQQYITESGTSFKYEIPVGEILEKWKHTEPWINKMLSLTHSMKEKNGKIYFISNLDVPPEEKHALIDLISSNIPSDDYYTLSHQQKLDVHSSVSSSMMLGIMRDAELFEQYLGMMSSQVHFVGESLGAYDDHLDEDATFLTSHLLLISGNINETPDVIRPICYSTAMYLCAMTEKLLRLMYLHMTAGRIYVPIERATLGELLSVNNDYMINALGKDHVMNLSFFFQQIGPKRIGRNLRNSLAHWAGITSRKMTVSFVMQLLWLYTDVLNSVFWYFIDVTPEGGQE